MRKPGRELTLIEAEAIEGLAREHGIELGPGESRRNVVTRGIGLNELVGRRFTVGEVECVGTELCDPCSHLQKLTRPGVLEGLANRGGLRADIVSAGRSQSATPSASWDRRSDAPVRGGRARHPAQHPAPGVIGSRVRSMTLYDLIARALRPAAWWGRIEVGGLDLVPAAGPLLVVPNHDSQWDPIVIGLALSRRRRLRFLARASSGGSPGSGRC